jgi:hypothetical protein
MPYYTRVLSKDAEFPQFDELADFISSSHPDYKLTVEEGTEEEWESLLLSGNDEVEVAILERNPVANGSIGQDEIAEFLEETQDCKPETGVEWLHEFLAEVKTVYAFQHLQGSETVDGGNALHCAHTCGSAETPSSRPTTKGSPTKKAFISCGSSLTQSRGRGTWGSCRTAPGITSRWILATPTIAKPSSTAKCPLTQPQSSFRAQKSRPIPSYSRSA